MSKGRRVPGKNVWGVAKSEYPSWYFDGVLDNSSGIHSKHEGALIGENSPYFPTLRDGESWFLYKEIIDRNKTMPKFEISLDDNRAYFTGVTIDGDKYEVSCCGEQLKHCKLEVFTSNLQLETRQAQEKQEVIIQGKPTKISFVLTARGQWLDRREIDLSNRTYLVTDCIRYD